MCRPALIQYFPMKNVRFDLAVATVRLNGAKNISALQLYFGYLGIAGSVLARFGLICGQHP